MHRAGLLTGSVIISLIEVLSITLKRGLNKINREMNAKICDPDNAF